MGKRGPKRSFIEISCPNRSCKRFGLTGEGNIIANSTHEASCREIRKFICKDCGRVFNSRTGTAYDRIRSSKEKFYMCIELHNEGMSVRAIVRTVGCSKDTVQRWTHSAAEQARGTASVFEKDLRPEALHMDELRSIVKKTKTEREDVQREQHLTVDLRKPGLQVFFQFVRRREEYNTYRIFRKGHDPQDRERSYPDVHQRQRSCLEMLLNEYGYRFAWPRHSDMGRNLSHTWFR